MSDVFQLRLADCNYYPYRLVKSRRAKYIRIKISAAGELSVVLPHGASEKHAHGFLQKKLQWIEKTIANIPALENKQFPEYLDLKLFNQQWKVKYIKSDINNNHLKEESEKCLVVTGSLEDWSDIKKLLNKWCKIKTKTIFKDMVEALAEEHGFHFNNLTIRSQKTRWGSCSNSKNISLNSKLIFMPIDVVKYVMIHELCHTIEMNHSSNFWRLVEDCDENYKVNRKTLKALGLEVVL